MQWVLASGTIALAARGQMRIDLGAQGKNIDFSAAEITRPSKTGTVLPTTCGIGETFLKTGESAGKNLFVSTAANVWIVQGIEMPGPSASANQVLTTDGTAFSWVALGGDVSGREASP